MKARTGLALVLLPLVAVITLFAFVDATVSYYRLPVTGIEIVTPSVDGMIAVDLARYDNDTYIVAEVRPAEAADKGYSLAVEGLSGTPSENLTLTEDGLVEPHGTGVFRVTAVSDDGGFRDSVTVGVYSSATLRRRLADGHGEILRRHISRRGVSRCPVERHGPRRTARGQLFRKRGNGRGAVRFFGKICRQNAGFARRRAGGRECFRRRSPFFGRFFSKRRRRRLRRAHCRGRKSERTVRQLRGNPVGDR